MWWLVRTLEGDAACRPYRAGLTHDGSKVLRPVSRPETGDPWSSVAFEYEVVDDELVVFSASLSDPPVYSMCRHVVPLWELPWYATEDACARARTAGASAWLGTCEQEAAALVSRRSSLRAEPDQDGDGIPDRCDVCPEVRENFGCGDDLDGCPDYDGYNHVPDPPPGMVVDLVRCDPTGSSSPEPECRQLAEAARADYARAHCDSQLAQLRESVEASARRGCATSRECAVVHIPGGAVQPRAVHAADERKLHALANRLLHLCSDGQPPFRVRGVTCSEGTCQLR